MGQSSVFIIYIYIYTFNVSGPVIDAQRDSAPISV